VLSIRPTTQQRPVEYTIEGFVEKNRDALEANIAEVLQASTLPFVAALIPPEAAVRTLGSQFKAQLLTLMETLNRTSPHFIRCIKSNNLKVSDTFDSQMVLRQLRYLGLKEVVKIRQSGFPSQRQGRPPIRRREKEKGREGQEFGPRSSVETGPSIGCSVAHIVSDLRA